ncbi:hypothetical protein ma123 [Moumouvirus australiensis]|uniref:Uncharacterized protein n=1 Tax=Moumouvirus australiensis TaxID=2109587 RepID=A0A2P1EKT8_9VIRU|nr:hypothetical protein QKC55_gp781 [Moumouvirus australiensis]AVL94509.1 hypothetical protein ma123 [Moumouvirus australiensis]
MEYTNFLQNNLFNYNVLYIIPLISFVMIFNFILFYGLGKSRRTKDIFNYLELHYTIQELYSEIITTANNSFRRSSIFHLIFVSILFTLTIYTKLHDYLVVCLLFIVIFRWIHVFICWTRIVCNSSGIHILGFILSFLTSLTTLIFIVSNKNINPINYVYAIVIIVGLVAPYLYASPLYFTWLQDNFIIIKMTYIGLDINHNLFGVESYRMEINTLDYVSDII